MKSQFTFKKLLFLGLAGIALPAFAQTDGEDVTKTAKVTITITENGETRIIEKEVPADESFDIESLMEEYGIDHDVEGMGEEENLEIIILKSTGDDTQGLNYHKGHGAHHGGQHRIMMGDMAGKPMLGIHVGDSEEGKGAKVIKVIPGSGAEAAGLQEGDVVTKIDGKPVTGFESLIQALDGKALNDEVSLDYIRDGKEGQTKAIMGERPENNFIFENDVEMDFDFDSEEFQKHMEEMELQLKEMEIQMEEEGMDIDGSEDMHFYFKDGGDGGELIEMGDANNMEVIVERFMPNEDGAFLGISPAHGSCNPSETIGVQIHHVTPESSAEKIGLQAGDVITKLNGEEIANFDELAKIIDGAEPGDKISVNYIRDGKKEKASGELMRRGDVAPVQHKMEFIDENGNHHAMHNGHGTKVHKEIRIRIEIDELSEAEARELAEKSEMDIKAENDLELNTVRLSPNPSSGLFELNIELAQEGDLQITVMDATGRIVQSKKVEKASGAQTQQLDLSAEEGGIYFVIIEQNGKQYNQKIVKH